MTTKLPPGTGKPPKGGDCSGISPKMGHNELPRIDADSWKETPEDIYIYIFPIEKWGIFQPAMFRLIIHSRKLMAGT